MQCKNCILDDEGCTTISFNADGVCNYCLEYQSTYNEKNIHTKFSSGNLSKILEQIKTNGKGKKYDCLLGVSGGVDSSYLAFLCKEYGLRPLIIHLDNGLNSELSVINIQNLLNKLGFDYRTHIIDWEEFRQMQRAFLRAGVIDIEALTDHAILATMLKMAKQYNIKYVLSGFNYATEAIMPKGWTWKKEDWINIKDICEKNGFTDFKTYPHLPFYKKLYYNFVLKMEVVQLLNFISYDKEKAKQLLKERFEWKDYGGKHFESVFTRFYQSYILPKKFGVDKRKAHLSNLILSKQITREQALEELKKPICDQTQLQEDKSYVLKKLGFNEGEFGTIMRFKPALHSDYKTESSYWNKYFKLVKLIKKVTFR